MTDKREKHIGSSFDDFLDEEGIKADVETVARKRVADLAAMLFGDQGVDLFPHLPVSVRKVLSTSRQRNSLTLSLCVVAVFRAHVGSR